MSTPIIDLDIKMPYAVRFHHATSTYMTIAAAERNAGGADWHVLPPGTYTLQLTYSGPEQAEIWFRAATNESQDARICQVPAGTGPRSSSPTPVVVSDTGGRLSIVTSPRSNAGATANALASVRVIPDQTYKPT